VLLDASQRLGNALQQLRIAEQHERPGHEAAVPQACAPLVYPIACAVDGALPCVDMLGHLPQANELLPLPVRVGQVGAGIDAAVSIGRDDAQPQAPRVQVLDKVAHLPVARDRNGR
jgi:hypothetical protein